MIDLNILWVFHRLFAVRCAEQYILVYFPQYLVYLALLLVKNFAAQDIFKHTVLEISEVVCLVAV